MMTCDIMEWKALPQQYNKQMTAVTFAKRIAKNHGHESHSKRKERCAVSQGRMSIIPSNSKIKREFKKNHFIPGKGQVTLLIHLIELDNLGKYKNMASSIIVIWDFLVIQKHDTGL